MSHRQSKAFRVRKRTKRQRQKAKKRPRLLALIQAFLAALKRPASLLTFLATILGLIGAWYTFKSKIDISCGTLVDRTNPYSTPFILTNSGLLPLYNIDWAVDLVDIDYGTKWNIHENTVHDAQKISPLDPRQKTTTFIGGPYSRSGAGQNAWLQTDVQIRKMEVLCSARYQNVLGLSEKQDFRFLCILDKDGGYQWFPFDSQRSRSAMRQ